MFPARRSGKSVDPFTKVKAASAMAAPEHTGWRLRDMRRSFAVPSPPCWASAASPSPLPTPC